MRYQLLLMRLHPILPCMFLAACANREEPPPTAESRVADNSGKVVIVDSVVPSDETWETADGIFETFESAVTVKETHFSQLHLIGTGRFSLDRIRAEPGAPSGIRLPVSAGGDQELRYGEGPGGIAGSHSMAVAIATSGHVDSVVSGYMGASRTKKFGSLTAGLMCRASGKERELGAYVARASFGSHGHNTVSFSLSVKKNGTMHSSYPSDVSGKFPLNLEEENVFIELQAVGDSITASCWKVLPTGEKVHLDSLSIRDDSHTSGAAGIFAFARGENSLFFDDIRAVPIP